MRFAAKPGFRSALVLACAALASHVPAPAAAQSPAAQNTDVVLNYVYAAQLGFGGYSLGGLTANVYTLPLADTLADTPGEGWGLKLLLPVQFGLYHFSGSYEGRHVSLNQTSLSFTPGLELQIPVLDRTVVKPFVQAGIAHGFGPGVGNPDSYVFLGGARSITQWQAGDYTLSFGNGVVFAGDATVGPGSAEHYVSLQIAGEVRRPLGFEIAGVKPDLGVYVANYYYPAPLRFTRFLKPRLEVTDQAEVGFSIGAADKFKLLWFSNPRIGAGVVFGGGLTVYHVNFGFPF